MIAWSIIVADLDGTFAAVPDDAGPEHASSRSYSMHRHAIASFGMLFLLWVIGLLILVLLPMGLFTSVLAPDHPERTVFMTTHQMLGLTVLLLVVLRVLWLVQSPAPEMRAEDAPRLRSLAKATHLCLYLLMLGFPVTGVLLTVWTGTPLEVFGWSVTALFTPSSQLAAAMAVVHNLVLPALF